MDERRSVSTAIWAILSILAGALMTEGGIMESIAYWPRGQAANIVVGAVGAVSSAVLLVSGVAMWTRRSFARRATITGALGMAPIHLLGWILGFVGVPGVLLGVVYPVVLLLVLRARPNLGAPVQYEDGPARLDAPSRSDHGRQREALNLA